MWNNGGLDYYLVTFSLKTRILISRAHNNITHKRVFNIQKKEPQDHQNRVVGLAALYKP
ncbi:hypothetical protein HanRHA438_Chr04g0150811 [Helianthus annuus]|nr:hypothetical protein HanRHA438_Chr04g0150811 [Helianthus annuus]